MNEIHTIAPEDINGIPPDLDGEVCERLLVQEFWYDGSREDEANVIYLLVASRWVRLYFDCGIVFWHQEKEIEVPIPPFTDNSQSVNSFPIRDMGSELGLNGRPIKGYRMHSIPNGVSVTLNFYDGITIVFENINDSTTVQNNASKRTESTRSA